MKILVINLLRIGDFLQVAPVVEGLTRKYPVRQVDVLCFAGVDRLSPLTPFVRRWWTLDRAELQDGLGRADVPLLTSFDILAERLDQISTEGYDLVINLTHTKFSGFVTGYVKAREKLGLAIDPAGRPFFHSPWIRYLDEHAQDPGADVFHHTDVFWQACGLDAVPKSFTLARTAAGRAEVDALGLDQRPIVAVQAFTSDERKTYPAEQLIAALDRLTTINPEVQLVLLAAPDEAARVEDLNARLKTRGTVAVTSMEGALSLLDRARVLITGDTSIKHLACFTGVRILELSLGPSDVRRTGAFKPGSFILQSPAACAPCGHAAGCSQLRLVCADEIDAKTVAQVADHLTRGEESMIEALAGHARSPILKTTHLESGFWYAVDVKTSLTARDVEVILGRCTWKFWLNQDFRDACAAYGSEGVRLSREIGSLVPFGERSSLIAHLDFLERTLEVDRVDEAPTSAAFVERRRAALTRDRVGRQREIRFKLIRSLKTRLLETA